jgi:hypothetical protein
MIKKKIRLFLTDPDPGIRNSELRNRIQEADSYGSGTLLETVGCKSVDVSHNVKNRRNALNSRDASNSGVASRDTKNSRVARKSRSAA